MKNIILRLFCLSILLYSCDGSKRDAIFNSIIYDELKLERGDQTIFFLSNEGCPSCNEAFLELILTLKEEDIIVIMSNLGKNIDISEISTLDKSKIFYDYKQLLIKHTITGANSAFIKVKHSKIDTIVAIKKENLLESVQYIKEHY